MNAKNPVPKKPTRKSSKRNDAAKPPKLKAQASCLAAAARVLGESGKSMTTGEMITAMAAKGYWSSPNGKTPGATLYSAILREITTKKTDSRFKKTARGKFALKGR